MMFKKCAFLIFSLFLISCGKGKSTAPDNTGYNGQQLTFNVSKKYYDQYKVEFDLISADILSKTGKQLVRFVPNDQDPKYETMGGAYNRFMTTGEAWIYFKDDASYFTDQSPYAGGSAYTGTNLKPMGVVVMNFTAAVMKDNYYFRQGLEHEVLHCLGFDHVTGYYNHSIMNYRWVYEITGVTDTDRAQLADKFPFSISEISIKDLEKMAAFNEKEESEKYAYNLVENFGLSEERAKTISRHLISYRKLNGQRDLTSREKDMLSKEILGFGFEKGKMALEKYMQGEQEGLDDLIEVAASKNETSPEHIKELFGEIFLK